MVPMDAEDTVCQLVETYSAMLLRLACTRLDSPADAEDVVQEVFLKLLTTRPVFRDAGHQKAWLIRTTLHRASDLRRSVARRNLPLEEAANAAVPETDNALWEAVRAVIEQLGIQDEPLMTDEARAALDTGAVRVEQDADGVYIIPEDGEALEAFTAEDFAAYVDAEKARLAQELQDGILSQATYDKSLSDLEADLAGVLSGSLTAYRVDGGYATCEVSGDYAVSYSATPDGTELTIH